MSYRLQTVSEGHKSPYRADLRFYTSAKPQQGLSKRSDFIWSRSPLCSLSALRGGSGGGGALKFYACIVV